MKKNALVVFGMLVAFGFGVNSISAQSAAQVNAPSNVITKSSKIDVEAARKIALKKVEGKIEEEFTLEEEDGKIIAYVFKIRDAKKKVFEVQADANDGKILYAEADPSY